MSFEVVKQLNNPALNSPNAFVEAVQKADNPQEALGLWSPTYSSNSADRAQEYPAAIAFCAANVEQTIGFDLNRIKQWKVPANVHSILNVPYVDDIDDGSTDDQEVRGHLLDVYMPQRVHEALTAGTLTDAERLPVFIDIHGGGFLYGYKELNRNFNMEITQRDFIVFSLSYREGATHTYIDTLTDISHAYSWILEYGAEYGADMSHIFVSGDSAGANMAFYSTANEYNDAMAKQTGVPQSGLKAQALVLVCGVYDLDKFFAPSSRTSDNPAHFVNLADSLNLLADAYFRPVADKFVPQFTTMGSIMDCTDMPPMFINTASDDFLVTDNLSLALKLAVKGKDFELDVARAGRNPGEELGHVYVIGMAWHPRAQRTLNLMRDFMHKQVEESKKSEKA